MTKFFLGPLIVSVCLITGLSQSRNQATAQEKRELLQQMAKDTEQLRDAINDYLGGFNGALKDMRVKKPDLNGDGQPDYIIELQDEEGRLCLRGNCPNWVSRKSGNGYKNLLHTTGTELSLEKTSTNGYRDLQSYEARDIPNEYFVYIYKYDGNQYQNTQCHEGKHVGKRIKVLPKKCE